MESLQILLELLKAKENTFKGCYFIPETWNSFGYNVCSTISGREDEINVNPYSFMIDCIENCIVIKKPDSDKESKQSVNIGKNVIYGMLPRMFTAWNHYDANRINQGTFLKSICLLPYLKKLNVDVIYLLPVFENSNLHKKGGIGSPYAIKNIYRLDGYLHDELLGDYTDEILELEFKAFVEACHSLGIKVMLDFVFRTCARDNDMILEHPDWFYWIYSRFEDQFKTPDVENEKEHTLISHKTMKSLYKSKGLKKYLDMFADSPKKLHLKQWQQALKLYEGGWSILEAIEHIFGVTTVPGFSDVLNDPQPPWTDVTYLKYYFDVHEEARQYINEGQPPYIMQDGAKLNLFRGKEPNTGLWEYVSGVIPFYQEKYGIDGARIDMGHAMPPELNKQIVQRAKENNRDFIFWSEEFQSKKSKTAKDDGFNFISGELWSIFQDFEKPGFSRKLLKNIMDAELPVAAAVETPDTPRAALMHPEREKRELILALSCFLPNIVPFINNGVELSEKQPMNLGLGNSEEGRFVLDPEDPMYGKLAFFDNYILHWNSKKDGWVRKMLEDLLEIRRNHIRLISDKNNFKPANNIPGKSKIIFLCYFSPVIEKGLFLLANRSLKQRTKADVGAILEKAAGKKAGTAELIYGNRSVHGSGQAISGNCVLNPGEFIIVEF